MTLQLENSNNKIKEGEFNKNEELKKIKEEMESKNEKLISNTLPNLDFFGCFIFCSAETV